MRAYFHPEPGIFLLGFSDDVRAILDHIQAEAPSLLDRVTLVDPSPRIVHRLKSRGLRSVCGPLADPATLREAGIHRAGIIAVIGDESTGRMTELAELVRLCRSLAPAAKIFLIPEDAKVVSPLYTSAGGWPGARVSPPGNGLESLHGRPPSIVQGRRDPTPPGGPTTDSIRSSTWGPSPIPRLGADFRLAWSRVRRWRFWVLVGAAVLDGLIFILPIALATMVLGALFAPDWLRRAARFLDAVAAGAESTRND